MSSIVSEQITMEQLEEGLARLDAKIYDLNQEIEERLIGVVYPFSGDNGYEPTEEESEFEEVAGEILELFGCISSCKHKRTILMRRSRAKYGTAYTVRDFEYFEKKRKTIKGLSVWTYAPSDVAARRWLGISETAYRTHVVSDEMRKYLTKLKAEYKEIKEENERRRMYLNV